MQRPLPLRRLIAALLLAAIPARADVVVQHFRVSSGTGFFVSRDGYALTNNHVVQGCTQVILKGPAIGGPQEITAEVRATDPQHDLALLYTQKQPRDTVQFSTNVGDRRPGEKVLVIGFPGEAWKTGEYKVVESSIINLQGAGDHPEWIQFADSVQHGNSGGPLLDESGNVIGVIVAMSWQDRQVFRVSAQGGRDLVSDTKTKVDMAINLATTEDFLRASGVDYRIALTGVSMTDNAIEGWAKDALVNVQCRIPETAAQAAARESGVSNP